MIQLTQTQKDALQKSADFHFVNGFSTILFARGLNNDAHLVCIDIESPDDFYNMSIGNNLPIKELLNQLGYCVSSYGFGICLNKPVGSVVGTANESTWQ